MYLITITIKIINIIIPKTSPIIAQTLLNIPDDNGASQLILLGLNVLSALQLQL